MDDSLLQKIYKDVTLESMVRKYHYGQFRNNTDGYLPPKVPYTDHLFSVREILSSALYMFGECKDEQTKKDMCDAAIGHDLLEDTEIVEHEIIGTSNRRVLEMIYELSNPVDDDHTDQYMEQLKFASEEARLVKYADLVENTISVCYNFHIVGEKWAYDFYRPIMYRTLRVLEGTEFPTYPQTAEFLHNMLKVYIQILNNKERTNLRQYPVRVLEATREAISEYELEEHLKKYRGYFHEYGDEYHLGLKCDQELTDSFSNDVAKGFFRYLEDKRLFFFFNEKSWDRFLKDYDLWKKGESPLCTEGEPWLWYEEYVNDVPEGRSHWSKRGQEASEFDKSSFFKLMDAFMIPKEFFIPESIREKKKLERLDFLTVIQRLVDYYKIKRKYIEAYPTKVKAPEREPGSIVRRTDFKYMNGHGTFYRFDKEHFTESILNAKAGDHLILVLYNLHTDQLDEVAFRVESKCPLGDKYIDIRGYIDDIEGCFEISIDYFLDNPMKSRILVSASALPDYNCFNRIK